MAPPLTGGSLIPQPKYRRFVKRVLCSLLVATLPFGSVLADAPKSKNAKVTLVYQHELPNVPGKSIKGVLGPGGYSPWSHACQIRLHLRDRARGRDPQVRSTTAP